MDAEKILAHAEHLVPGLVTLALAATRVPTGTALMPNQALSEVFQQPFIASTVLIAAAYLLGAFLSVVSRFFVDTVSALTFRPIFLKAFRWSDFQSLSPIEINRTYRYAIERAQREPAGDAVRQEVLVRRQRGRLLRTLLVPLLLLLEPQLSAPMLLAVYLGLVAIYAYTELTIYQEAKIAA